MEQSARNFMNLDGRSILITGGTGSFGQQFAEILLKKHNPRKIIILSRDEHKQYKMQQSVTFGNTDKIRYFIGDVRDLNRLRMAMQDVDDVFHAAALKHVPTAEYNPLECIHTNVNGAENVVSAAIDCGVKNVVALSTDKAVNPINIYGASKFASDKIFVSANLLAGDRLTKFSVVRYGNVLGSRGSIVPLIRALVRDGAGTIPLTDERMTRFWITLNQGIEFVLASAATMKGGEIFVPKVPSMRVTDMMDALAPTTPKEVIGVRPGEKLHEVLISEEDTSVILEQPDRYVICPPLDPTVQSFHMAQGAKLCARGFRYASDNNGDWLDAQMLRTLLENT